jgi:hypothetical protein
MSGAGELGAGHRHGSAVYLPVGPGAVGGHTRAISGIWTRCSLCTVQTATTDAFMCQSGRNASNLVVEQQSVTGSDGSPIPAVAPPTTGILEHLIETHAA